MLPSNLKLLKNTQIDNYEKVKLFTQLLQGYKGNYSTQNPLKMHIEREEIQPINDTIKRQLHFLLSDDDDLPEIMPTLKTIVTDNVISHDKVHADIMASLPKYALKV